MSLSQHIISNANDLFPCCHEIASILNKDNFKVYYNVNDAQKILT